MCKLETVQTAPSPTAQDDRYRTENERNSAKLLDRDDIFKISYSVRRAGFPVCESLSPGPAGPPGQGSEMCTLENRLYVQNNLTLEYCLSSNFADRKMREI